MVHSDDTTQPAKSHNFLAASLAIAASLLRLFPHPWNFAPMGAIGLFAGARLRGWYGVALPLGLAVFTDLALWFRYPEYSPFQPFTYICYFVCTLLGRLIERNSSPFRIAGLALVCSAIFFVVTNVGAWVQWPHVYPDRSLTGVWQSLIAGIPFYRGTFFGDLIYTPVLFGAFALLTRVVGKKAAAPVPIAIDAERESP
jgi:hypothetical protein